MFNLTAERVGFIIGTLIGLAITSVLILLFPPFLHYTVWVWTEAWKSPWYWLIGGPICATVVYFTYKFD